jgi:hypothetical protein
MLVNRNDGEILVSGHTAEHLAVETLALRNGL